jgi:hypothetical protein
MANYGELTYHGLDCWTYNEAEAGVSGEDFGEGDWHGLDVLVYKVAGGHPALRRLGLFPTGFEFDRSQQVRWG